MAPLSTSERVTARVKRHPGDRRAEYGDVRPVPTDAPKVACFFDLVLLNPGFRNRTQRFRFENDQS